MHTVAHSYALTGHNPVTQTLQNWLNLADYLSLTWGKSDRFLSTDT